MKYPYRGPAISAGRRPRRGGGPYIPMMRAHQPTLPLVAVVIISSATPSTALAVSFEPPVAVM